MDRASEEGPWRRRRPGRGRGRPGQLPAPAWPRVAKSGTISASTTAVHPSMSHGCHMAILPPRGIEARAPVVLREGTECNGCATGRVPPNHRETGRQVRRIWAILSLLIPVGPAPARAAERRVTSNRVSGWTPGVRRYVNVPPLRVALLPPADPPPLRAGPRGTNTEVGLIIGILALPREPGRQRGQLRRVLGAGVGGGTIVMGRLADARGFRVMFLAVAALPLLGLGGLRWLRGSAGHIRRQPP